MSSKNCKECRHFVQNNNRGCCTLLCDRMCDDDRACTYFAKPTIFDCITASPEVLAPEFVGMMYNRVCGDYLNYSMLTGEWYATHAEAIAATLEKLKEVADGD